MQSDDATVRAIRPVQDLLAEAGKAIVDKTGSLNLPALPVVQEPLATPVEGSVAKGGRFRSLANTGAFAVNTISSTVTAVGKIGSDGVMWGMTVVVAEAHALSGFGQWAVGTLTGTLRPEKEALLQDALRKHDALLHELQTKNAGNAEQLEYLYSLVIRLKAVIRSLKVDLDPAERDILTVLTTQDRQIKADLQSADFVARKASGSTASAEALLAELAAANSAKFPPLRDFRPAPPTLRPWSEVLAEAHAECVGVPSFDDILSPEEQAAVRQRLSAWNEEFGTLHQLTGFDYAVAGVAGILAALADITLVMVPKHPGFLGGPRSEGGWLSNVLKERFEHLLPQDTVRALEKDYPVPYDASTNFNLDRAVAGLGPRSHRLHSLGHDPILGWIFGVRDILAGAITTVAKDGSFDSQANARWEAEEAGVTMLEKVLSAFRSVGGHMLSDVSTPAGLPPPLFVLSQFFQFGNIRGRSIAEIARLMYRSGFDFRHFLAGGLCVALIETIVRLGWLAREMAEGRTLEEALPVASNPRLRTSLLLAHGVAAAVNAGKVAVTRNPLALNWAQWLALFRYLMPQLHWWLVGKENQRESFIQEKLDVSWAQFDFELAKTWQTTFGSVPAAVL
jgi:hypothetical protein